MQNGSVIRAQRQRGSDVWEFRWRETSADDFGERVVAESNDRSAMLAVLAACKDSEP